MLYWLVNRFPLISGNYIQKTKSTGGWFHLSGIRAVVVEGVSIENITKKAMDTLLGIGCQKVSFKVNRLHLFTWWIFVIFNIESVLTTNITFYIYFFLEQLQSLGITTSDIVAMHLYVKNMQNFVQINQVYKTYFGLNPPIR